jgi:hypothetical protein
MTAQDAFEAWCKADFPECDLTRLPSGNYRIKSTQDKWEGWSARDRLVALQELNDEAQRLGFYPEVV